MKLQERISILSQLSEYLQTNPIDWQIAKQKAAVANLWFVPPFIDLATENICKYFLQKPLLEGWVEKYGVTETNPNPVTVGLTMAGNIPLVGFHDFLTIFISGHKQIIKPSAKDSVLIRFITELLSEWDNHVSQYVAIAEQLKGCDAYIATGSNNSGRYFEYYFGKYPHIIRKNRTSAAILTGKETLQELEALAADILLYFGLGCRNVSKIYVPRNYDFEPLLKAFGAFSWMADHDKYRNNYDYQLSLLMLNNQYYMSNPCLLLTESASLFSPISVVHYSFYDSLPQREAMFREMGDSLQCIAGKGGEAFGKGQQPQLTDYADGVDSLLFCLSLKK